MTRFSVTPELQIWDITVLRFCVRALLLPLAVLRRGSRLPAAAWREGLVFAVLWSGPFVLLVALGLQLTSAAEAAAGFGHRNRHHRPSSSRCRGDQAIPVVRNTPSFAEGAAIGVILLGVLLASKPTPGHNTPPVPQA